MNVPTRMLLWCEKPLCRDFRKGSRTTFRHNAAMSPMPPTTEVSVAPAIDAWCQKRSSRLRSGWARINRKSELTRPLPRSLQPPGALEEKLQADFDRLRFTFSHDPIRPHSSFRSWQVLKPHLSDMLSQHIQK